MKKEEEQGGASKPISLAPLKFDDALAGLLKVKPPTKDNQKSRPSQNPKPNKKVAKRQ